MANEFNVMDMIDDYAAESGIKPEDVFKKNEEPTKEEVKEEPKKAAPGEWRPDADLLEGMDELKTSGASYSKDEVVMEERKLVNGADEELKTNIRENMSDLELKGANIEEAKKRNGIKTLQIPENDPDQLYVRFMIAAGSHNHEEAQDLLDQLLKEVEERYPEMILERYEEPKKVTEEKPRIIPLKKEETSKEESIEGIDTPEVPRPTLDAGSQDDTVKIVIDKTKVSEVVWSPEEVSKIKKSRTLELNIVEGVDLAFGDIEDVPDNAVDAVLSTYQRKTNDIASPLPASKYRAVFTGLSYPEVIDMSAANEINTLDGERKKWSIVYSHMKNMSIGPWREYAIYKDPATNMEVKVNSLDDIPDNIPSDNEHRHFVSKYEDFLRHTSYIDLEFCMWKILCATAMDKEVISIDCHTDIGGGKRCDNTYDWVYSPNDLLNVESIDPAVLKEMEDAANATSVEDAINIYNTSPVASTSYVELHSSGFRVVYGHLSAYDWLEKLYPRIKEMENSEDPEIVSKSAVYGLLTTTKMALVPNGKGGFQRIRGIDNLFKVVSMLDEVDFETLSKLNEMMITPYQFKFSMRDIVCPKCKNKSMIPIDDMSRLLFIVARSLSSVNITLKRT